MPPRTSRIAAAPQGGGTTEAGDPADWNASEPLFTKGDLGQRLCAFIAAAMDLGTMSICPICFRVLILWAINDTKTLGFVLLKFPEVLKTALRLIVLLSEAEANIPALRVRLQDNVFQCSGKETLHRMRTTSNTRDPFDRLLEALYCLVTYALKRGPKPMYDEVKHQASQKHFFGRKGIWPLELKDLFPLGIERTLDAFLFWCCVPFTVLPFDVLNGYLAIARPVIINPLLALTPNLNVPWPADCAVPFTTHPGLRMANGLRGDEKMVNVVLATLGMLRASVDTRRDDVRHFLTGFETEFLGVMQALSLEELGLEVHLSAVEQYRCILCGGRQQCEHDAPDRALYVHGYIFRSVRTYRCAGLDCSRHELGGIEDDEEPRELFRRCGGCKVMPYCNVGCQRAHWKLNAPTHREVCEVLRGMMGRGVDMFSEYPNCFLNAYDELSTGDAELLFAAAAQSQIMPDYRHLAESHNGA
ncbi:hypothetical protein AURDEDRAFT_130753 [Auricularia subglabra TFB-10046 SS5]|uniref:MYND-type domain-containing protein n=1 Tax=Auricularia subglabra (strain TFB-10046 / SS5) TaxID=717982 RepID=J0WSR0_AURST|nr:hypothetical protein AURDEDRAFT_130753 [Auricularia subglabra TFB-10046 SS5]